MRVQPIRRIAKTNREGRPMTQERVLEQIKMMQGLDGNSSTVVELNSTSELPAFLYDKTGKLK